MFGMIGDRLRRWLSGSAGLAAGDAAAATAERPGCLEPGDSSNGANNTHNSHGSGAEVEVSGDSGWLTREPAQLNEYSQE